jgi:hypothetical protein
MASFAGPFVLLILELWMIQNKSEPTLSEYQTLIWVKQINDIGSSTFLQPMFFWYQRY